MEDFRAIGPNLAKLMPSYLDGQIKTSPESTGLEIKTQEFYANLETILDGKNLKEGTIGGNDENQIKAFVEIAKTLGFGELFSSEELPRYVSLKIGRVEDHSNILGLVLTSRYGWTHKGTDITMSVLTSPNASLISATSEPSNFSILNEPDEENTPETVLWRQHLSTEGEITGISKLLTDGLSGSAPYSIEWLSSF